MTDTSSPTVTISDRTSPSTTTLDAAHEAHLGRVLSQFNAEARAKYCRGQAEHKGNLWEKPGLLENAIEEAIDQVVYLMTLREQTAAEPAQEPRRQSRGMSLTETLTNVVVGYGVACATQMLVLPLFGVVLPLRENLLIGLVFTVVSIVRSYTLRRVFNRWL